MEPEYRPSFAGVKRKINNVDSANNDEEDDSGPAHAFRGFAPARDQSQSPSPTPSSSMRNTNRSPWKKATNSGASTPGGGGGAGGGKFGSSNSFAARMMAKMGYKEGEGLGASGQGIVNPVETVLRPQGAGLGAVKEKTQQAKDEAKREAARKGEVLEDSSDEERKKRQKRKEEKRRLAKESGTSSGRVTPRGSPKPKFRTAREIESDTAGLEVPNVLKSLIDATGKEQKLLTSTAGLMTGQEFIKAEEGEALKIAQRARNDLEAFADEWKSLTERKNYVDTEETHVVQEMDAAESNIDQLSAMTTAVQALEGISLEDKDLDNKWEETTSRLEQLDTDYPSLVQEYNISEVAVAALHPLFQQSMEEWEPLKDPTYLVSNLRRLHRLVSSRRSGNDDEEPQRQRQSTTPYESMIYTLWLPKIRSVLLNDWDTHNPGPATTLVDAWKDVLPGFVYANVLDQLVVPKLSSALKEWKPRSSRKENGSSFPWWLFDWLRYLDERHTDPKAPTGLLSDAKRKFRSVLDNWNLSRGLVGGIDVWRDVLGSEFHTALRNHILPRLARHLREDFDVNPQDQQLDAFEDVLKWKDYFKPSVFAMLLSAEFFPKWLAILHLWLTSDPNYEEVGQWFSWWKTQVPDEINAVDEVAQEWNRGLEMMNLALDLGEKAKTELPPPPPANEHQQRRQKQIREREQARRPPVPKVDAASEAGTKPRRQQPIEEPTFKDVVEEWCADEGLIMVPLREAHVQSGLPLFRITASANGKGGVVVYLKGDVVWAQNRKARETFEPAGLDAGLVARAEGK